MDRLDMLKVFCTVVEVGAFSRAAEKLSMSTSSVTTHVAALEAHFKVRLLNRTTRSMSLTEEGRHCHQQALRLLADMGELEAGLRASDTRPAGVLRVDLPSVISRRYVAPALPRFLRQYPELELRITVSDRMVDMVEEGVDVLVRIGALGDSGLVARKLAGTCYLCCAAPAFLQQYGWPETPEALDQFACLGFLNPRTRMVRPWRFSHEGKESSHIPRGLVTMDHVESMVAAAQAGCGIIQQMSVTLAPALQEGSLLPVLPAWQAPGPDIVALYQPTRRETAKVKVFVEFLREIFTS
ncbi:LysR family transcriptional regulator [Herbaspirillum sp. AP02]|uniref:LysR family transcriptional regulator n=1 Tax=unclassified Herbaspirillum TaxID=2624150 RepID=UPI0015DA4CEE|nr:MULTISPECIES: LysR family transcriptional regulator [unclassified Herbaspirillum]MBG7620891.1 LysR family transcriptional regulator [Herbaspirillum sp. AP02]NZD68354.1 LysR family transcriptional regulator [Herbaspirillum sp. AP21]